MRTSYLIFLIAFSTLLSCKTGDSGPDIGKPVSTFSAKVNGKSFTSSDIQGAYDATSLYINATGYGGTGKEASISLVMKRISSLGTYNIDSNTLAQYLELGVPFKATAGTITVSTNNDVHVAGNFTFEASDSVTHYAVSVTSGSFDLYK
jgi:hypothetical protein